MKKITIKEKIIISKQENKQGNKVKHWLEMNQYLNGLTVLLVIKVFKNTP